MAHSDKIILALYFTFFQLSHLNLVGRTVYGRCNSSLCIYVHIYLHVHVNGKLIQTQTQTSVEQCLTTPLTDV